MAAYLSPGVFVEEIDSGARPIEAVGTSTAGFVGAAPQADAHVDEAFAINNWAQFRALQPRLPRSTGRRFGQSRLNTRPCQIAYSSVPPLSRMVHPQR